MFVHSVYVAVALSFAPTVLSAWIACASGHYIGTDRQCHPCPAGQSSASIGIMDNSRPSSCTPCSPGTYAPTPGSLCSFCQGGSFNAVSGSKSCCQCCAGWYSSGANFFHGPTSCSRCSSGSKYSPVGSDSSLDCRNRQNGLPDPVPAGQCQMSGNICPATTVGGPVNPSGITKRHQPSKCAPGYKRCPRLSGIGGFDCVDVRNDVESCGGCIDLDGTNDAASGEDCTAIPGVNVTACVKGKCKIVSCRAGQQVSPDGKSCIAPEVTVQEPRSSRRHRRHSYGHRQGSL